jgi:hypothetical protein
MNSLTSKLYGIASFIFFPLLIIFLRRKKNYYVFICLVFIALTGCYLNFYRTNTKPSIDPATASRLSSELKYFVIHFANSTNGLEQAKVEGDMLYGKIVPLPFEHSKYLHPDSGSKKNRVKKKDKNDALVEVHLYTNAELKYGDSLFSASLTSFNRADVYELNKGATTANHILSTVGVVLVTTTIIGLIAFAIACNCPQVYVDNNGAYSFTGGMYSGAVYSTLERMDYLPLNSVPYNAKEISFKIANVKNEQQFINKAELLQINHLSGTHILPDRHGDIHSYNDMHFPVKALINNRDDIKDILKKTDGAFYSFDNAANDNGFSDVKLSFDKPGNVPTAKLVIHARNTYWAGLLHKEFLQLFGENFEKWREKQEKANTKELEKWQTDQAIPLMVYMKTASGWKFVDYFPLIGNTATRDMIMQIDTKDIRGNKIELKLETAYRFWDLDFAGIDYSADKNFTINIIKPETVLKSDSTDQKTSLLNNDKMYTHLADGEFILFKYALPASAGNTVSSYVLASGGYYHTMEPITGKTNYKELYKFQKKGAFDQFSREKFKEAEDVAVIMKSITRQQ